jgi:urease gamma subunit
VSLPNEPDFALIKVRTATGPDVFTILCGLENVNVNEAVSIKERQRRDCAKPNRPGQRKITATGSTWQITGAGVLNVDQEAVLAGVRGVIQSYKVEAYLDDGTDAGDLMGTWAGSGMLTARDRAIQVEGDSGLQITIEGQDELTWTAAA